jgi:hypothetical protein
MFLVGDANMLGMQGLDTSFATIRKPASWSRRICAPPDETTIIRKGGRETSRNCPQNVDELSRISFTYRSLDSPNRVRVHSPALGYASRKERMRTVAIVLAHHSHAVFTKFRTS